MRSGDLPTYTFDFSPGLTAPRGRAMRRAETPEGSIETQLFGYRFDDLRLTQAIQVMLPPRLADGLDIAVSIYIADRYAQRPSGASQNWHRHIAVRIPVRDETL